MIKPIHYHKRLATKRLRQSEMNRSELRKSMNNWSKQLRITRIGALFACLLMFQGCANHCADIQPRPAIPDYLIAHCTYPEPRPVETQEDMLRLLTDFSNDLENCDMKHRLLVKFLEENSK